MWVKHSLANTYYNLSNATILTTAQAGANWWVSATLTSGTVNFRGPFTTQADAETWISNYLTGAL